MKVELDENLGNRSIELFRRAGHDVSTVEEQNLASASDRILIHACREESRALVTLDLDFSNVFVFPPSEFAGIAVLRTPHPTTLDALHEHEPHLYSRTHVVVNFSERRRLSATASLFAALRRCIRGRRRRKVRS